MTLLDTHVLLWSRFGSREMGPRCRHSIRQALLDGELAASAFSFWEVALLHAKGRMSLSSDISAWRTSLLDNGLTEIPVDGEVGIRANALSDFHRDPADRIIVATALDGHRLITADHRILTWVGPLDRQDARE